MESRARSLVTLAHQDGLTQARGLYVPTASLSLCAEPFIGAYLDDVKIQGSEAWRVAKGDKARP